MAAKYKNYKKLNQWVSVCVCVLNQWNVLFYKPKLSYIFEVHYLINE